MTKQNKDYPNSDSDILHSPDELNEYKHSNTTLSQSRSTPDV